ncbi:MAG: hypothetical protein IKE27_10710 [Oscillospiraceae bacterium]|nr:hypothetical protein [Oscillospiraceae bacterium]
MYFGNGSRAEFGQPPPEDNIPREQELYPRDEFSLPREEYLADELAAPGPEYAMPGELVWIPERKKRETPFLKTAMFYLSAALVVLMGFGLLKGPSAPVIPTDTPSQTQPSGPDAPPPVVEPEPEPPEEEYIAPKCDLVAFSFSSEIRGSATFTDMENAEKVTYEIWDPLTGGLELQEDITEQAMTGLYEIGPFYTDFIFERHETEYRENNSFPMEIEIRVIIDHPEGPDTYSVVTKNEIGWYTMYERSDGAWSDYPGCMIVKILDSVDDFEIVFDEPEKVGPGVMSISCDIDGHKVDPSQFRVDVDQFEATFSDGHKGTVIYRTVVMRKPVDVEEGGDSVAHFTITHYLENYDRVYVSEDYVRFDDEF